MNSAVLLFFRTSTFSWFRNGDLRRRWVVPAGPRERLGGRDSRPSLLGGKGRPPGRPPFI